MNHLNVVRQTLVEKRLLKFLIDGLKGTLAWQIQGDDLSRKLSTLKFINRSFQSHMERLMSIEERDGYMDIVIEKQPQLTNSVDALRRQHEGFRQAMSTVTRNLDGVASTDRIALNRIVDQLNALLKEVDEHNKREADLLQEALEREEGGEG